MLSISIFACSYLITFIADFEWNTEIKPMLFKLSDNPDLIGNVIVIMVASIEVDHGLDLGSIKRNTVNIEIHSLEYNYKNSLARI